MKKRIMLKLPDPGVRRVYVRWVPLPPSEHLTMDEVAALAHSRPHADFLTAEPAFIGRLYACHHDRHRARSVQAANFRHLADWLLRTAKPLRRDVEDADAQV